MEPPLFSIATLLPLAMCLPMLLLMGSVLLAFLSARMPTRELKPLAEDLLWLGALTAVPAGVIALTVFGSYELSAVLASVARGLVGCAIAAAVFFRGVRIWQTFMQRAKRRIPICPMYAAMVFGGCAVLFVVGAYAGENFLRAHRTNAVGSEPTTLPSPRQEPRELRHIEWREDGLRTDDGRAIALALLDDGERVRQLS